MIRIKIPATTANLGPGFDTLGLAVNLWNEVEITPAERFSITVKGEGAGVLPQDGSNLIVQAAQQVFNRAGKKLPALHFHCANRIPLGAGLGSSSAAVLGGLLAANVLLEEPFSAAQILKMAVEVEGHPDNAAPALAGGLVSSMMADGQIITRSLAVKALCLTVALPDFAFPTRQARAVLPQQIARADAIYNISRAVLVVEALRSGDLELLEQAMDDRLHQPYRLPLVPGAQAAMEAMKAAGAAAVALSGAGPSLVAFSGAHDGQVGAAALHAFQAAGLDGRVFYLKISRKGAQTLAR